MPVAVIPLSAVSVLSHLSVCPVYQVPRSMYVCVLCVSFLGLLLSERLSVSGPLTLCISDRLRISVFLCLTLSLSLSLLVDLRLNLCLSLSVPLCVSVYVACMCFSSSFSLPVYLFLGLCLFLSLVLCFWVTVWGVFTVWMCISVFMHVLKCVFLHVFLPPCCLCDHVNTPIYSVSLFLCVSSSPCDLCLHMCI